MAVLDLVCSVTTFFLGGLRWERVSEWGED
jgi:hypothetical protein